MPELPEVETLRRDLEKEIVGKKIKSVDVTGKRSTRRHKNSDDFVSRIEGTKVTEVRRRGKYLLLALDSGDVVVVHFAVLVSRCGPSRYRAANPLRRWSNQRASRCVDD